MSTPNPQAERELILQREFDAPRTLVWKAWTDPQHIGQWWGPKGFTITTIEMDVRPGGSWRYIMHAPDGTNYDNRITYRELLAPERMVYDHGSDKDDDPDQFLVTVTFDQRGEKTYLTMRMLFQTIEQREQTAAFGAVEIGYQTLAHLADHLESMH